MDKWKIYIEIAGLVEILFFYVVFLWKRLFRNKWTTGDSDL